MSEIRRIAWPTTKMGRAAFCPEASSWVWWAFLVGIYDGYVYKYLYGAELVTINCDPAPPFSIYCHSKNPCIILSGITLPRVVHGPFILHPCLPGWALLSCRCSHDRHFFHVAVPTTGAYFSSPGPKSGTYFTSLFPGRTTLVAAGRILHHRLTRPMCVSTPTAGQSDAVLLHRELARLACVPLTAGGKSC